jgi:hypothetical protein
MPNQKIYYNNRTGCFTICKTNNCPVDPNVVNVCKECADNGKYCECTCEECRRSVFRINECNECTRGDNGICGQ